MITDIRPATVTRIDQGHRSIISWFAARPNFTALVIYAIIALIANFPVYPGDPNRLSTTTSYDVAQTTWFLEYTPYAILHGHNLFYTNIINYPIGVNLAQNTGMPLLGLLTAPLTLLVSPVASLNLLRFLAFALSGFSAFWVFRQFTRWAPAAFIGGLLYGFSPYMVTQGLIHLNLIFVPLPPLILYALYEICVQQRGSARKWGLLLGLFSVAQFYISAEVLATTAIVACIGLLCLLLLCIREVLPRLRHLVSGAFYATIVIAPCVAYPVWIIMHGAAHYTGPAQGYNSVFNADLLGPIIPTVAQLIAPRHFALIGSRFVAGAGDLSENGSYLGIPLIMLVIYFVARYWRRLWPLYLALIALITFLFSLGSKVIVDHKVQDANITLPFEKISHLPFLENILPVRFSLYVIFFVASILVLGLEWLHDDRVASRSGLWLHHAEPHRQFTQGIGWFLGIAATLSLLPAFPYQSFPVHVNWSESTRGLKIVPANSRTLTYPYPTVFADDPMLWQALDSMKFTLYGSYALVPSTTGTADLFPVRLAPVDVQAMLINSVTPTPDPDVPDLVATKMTMNATSITELGRHARIVRGGTSTTLTATIQSIDRANGTIVVWVHRLIPILVETSPTTTYAEKNVRHPSLAGLAPLMNISVSGIATTGTVNSTTTLLLRRFILQNRVQTVIVDLGRRDSGEIAVWFRDALGKPTRAGAGGEVWLDAGAKAQRYLNTP